MSMNMDMLLAKAGPMTEAGNGSVMTYLRKKIKTKSQGILF